MITFDQERPQDFAEIDALLDAAFGPKRLEKSSNLLRHNNPALARLSVVMRAEGQVVATVRFTPVHVAGSFFGTRQNALLLGPLAVHPMMQGAGLGTELLHHALAAVDNAGYERIFLVGSVSYYHRFGFEHVMPKFISLPDGRDAARLLMRGDDTCEPLPTVGALQAGWSAMPEAEHQLIPAL